MSLLTLSKKIHLERNQLFINGTLLAICRGMSHLINKGENTMQHLNGMELVALSIHVDQDRARREFVSYVKEDFMEIALAVTGMLLLFLSVL